MIGPKGKSKGKEKAPSKHRVRRDVFDDLLEDIDDEDEEEEEFEEPAPNRKKKVAKPEPKPKRTSKPAPKSKTVAKSSPKPKPKPKPKRKIARQDEEPLEEIDETEEIDELDDYEVEEKVVKKPVTEVKRVAKPSIHAYVDSHFGNEVSRSFLMESMVLDDVRETGTAPLTISVAPDLQSTLLTTMINNLTRIGGGGGVRFL